MNEIVKLIDDDRLEWREAFPLIEEFSAKLDGRDPRELDPNFRGTEWMDMYKYETAYRYLKITEPCQIPKRDIIGEAARQYKRMRTVKRSSIADVPCYSSKIPVIPPERLLDIANLG